MNILTYCCTGGTSVSKDIISMSGKVHLVIGTPGRVWDMMRRETFIINNVSLVVIDKADEMFAGNLLENTLEIFSKLPKLPVFRLLSPLLCTISSLAICVTPLVS